ncbi:MAG TPA: alpha-ketoacid dehydrogenase subunit beta [Anaerolineae bacterium]|nr:alpha-ketoacid dehydrogenase subunit beta [Anaerolineae bacterium]
MNTVLESLNRALLNALKTDERVLLMGEDILDPYGGSFKVSKGLSTKFPKRVLTTPISEAGFTGLAAGMAMRGLLPVVEIMFGDFVTLIADQLINHIVKFPWMYNQKVTVPIVIRAPMGGRRGYGPTHSQTLEKLYLGVPGLVVLAPTALGNPGRLLEVAIFQEKRPVLFVENKLLYLSKLFDINSSPDYSLEQIVLKRDHLEKTENYYPYPIYVLKIADAPKCDLTLVTYGYMAEVARNAMLRLAYESEIFVEMIVPTILAPYQCAPVIRSLDKSKRLLVVEEGTLTLGWGAEVITRVVEQLPNRLRAIHRLASKDFPIPASGYLEREFLPNEEDIVAKVRKIMKES